MTIGRVFRPLLGKIQRSLAERAWGVRGALKIRNQANAIISCHLNDWIDPETNGEGLVARVLAPSVHTVVDVGANVGAWLAQVWPYMPSPKRALAFEPSAAAANCLRARFSSDNCVEIIEKAVLNHSGIIKFFEEPEAGETSSTIPYISRADAKVRQVDSTTLDAELLDKDGYESIDFLKIDAEGADYYVLLGATELLQSGRIRVLQFEYNGSWAPAGATLGGAKRFLESFGFQIYLIKKEGLFLFDYAKFGEYFGYSNFLAIQEQSKKTLMPIVRGAL